MAEFNWMIECAAFAVMLGLSVVVGLYFGCVKGHQDTVDEYLLGGKHMSVFPITMSLIASHISGVTLIGIPSEIYYHGTQYLLSSMINVIVVIIVLYIYLPVFYELQCPSIYEYLERRFNSTIRSLTSIVFAISIIMFVPVVVYVPALAYNQVTGLNIFYITPFICAICIFYTTIGGLKAVVWTDAIQSIFTAFALVLVIILGLRRVGGFSNLIQTNIEGDRLELFRMDPDPFLRTSFWTISIGMTLFWIGNLGIHPGAVQRFVALPTFKKAKTSLIYYFIGMSVIQMLSGLVGMIIYSMYKDCDPNLANIIKNDKNLVPYSITDIAGKYPGITGLYISGIVSAALSTMSACLNTVAGTIYEDFIQNIIRVKVSESKASVIMKCIVVVVGIVCVILVLLVEKLKGIIQMALSLNGMFTGGVLSVFTLGVCFPWANSKGAMFGLLASFGVMFLIGTGAQMAMVNNELLFVGKNVSTAGCPTNVTLKNQTDYSGLYRLNDEVYVSPNVWKIFAISYMHYSTVGTLVGVAVGLVVSLLFPSDEVVDPVLLTPCIRRFVRPDYMIDSKNSNGTKVDDYTLVSQETRL